MARGKVKGLQTMKAYTIFYDHPDHPGMYVMVVNLVGAGKVQVISEPLTFKSLNEARRAIPDPNVVRFPRDPSDDKTVVETWL